MICHSNILNMSQIPKGYYIFEKDGECKLVHKSELPSCGCDCSILKKGKMLDKVPSTYHIEEGDYVPYLKKKGSEAFEKARSECNKERYQQWLNETDGYWGAPGNCDDKEIKEYMKKNNVSE